MGLFVCCVRKRRGPNTWRGHRTPPQGSVAVMQDVSTPQHGVFSPDRRRWHTNEGGPIATTAARGSQRCTGHVVALPRINWMLPDTAAGRLRPEWLRVVPDTHVYRAGIGEALKGHANPKEGLLCWFIKLLI